MSGSLEGGLAGKDGRTHGLKCPSSLASQDGSGWGRGIARGHVRAAGRGSSEGSNRQLRLGPKVCQKLLVL